MYIYIDTYMLGRVEYTDCISAERIKCPLTNVLVPGYDINHLIARLQDGNTCGVK